MPASFAGLGVPASGINKMLFSFSVEPHYVNITCCPVTRELLAEENSSFAYSLFNPVILLVFKNNL